VPPKGIKIQEKYAMSLHHFASPKHNVQLNNGASTKDYKRGLEKQLLFLPMTPNNRQQTSVGGRPLK
jgi:hypothetical protein